MELFLKTASALNDETRVKLLKFINLHGKLCVCDLEKSFDMIQSRLSRHLKLLKEAGFLDVNREGRWAFYTIKNDMQNFNINSLEEIKNLKITLPLLQKNCKSEEGK